MNEDTTTFWGMDGWETVYPTIEEAVEYYTDYGGEIDAKVWPAEFLEYYPTPKPDPEAMLEGLLDILDDMLSTDEHDDTKPTPAMLAAMKTILDEYVVHAVDETGNKVAITREQAEEMLR